MNKIDILGKFHNSLYCNLIKKYKKEKYKSLLIWFLDIKSNDRLRLIKDSHINKIKIPKELFNELLDENLIKDTDVINEYVITAKGIWEYETSKQLLCKDNLLKYLDDKYFKTFKSKEKEITDKQKVILLTMIAARTFSKNSLIDLKMSESALKTWKDIATDAYDLLSSLNFLKDLKKHDLFYKREVRGNEKEISHLFRHCDEIPKITKGVFQALGKQQYFLNLYKDGKINKEDLKFILKKIFSNKKLSIADVDKISEFCNKIATEKNVYIFDIRNHIFHNPKYDSLIRDALITL